MDWAEYAVSGFPRSWICDTWQVGLGGADHADADDRGGLDDGAGGLPGLPLPAGRQGPERPDLPRSAARLLRSQHHLAHPAGRVRELEFSVEALLALEPGGRVRGRLRRPRGDEPDGPLGSDVRLHRRAGSRLGCRRQRGAGWSSAGPLPRRVLDPDPPQGGPGWAPPRVSPHG